MQTIPLKEPINLKDIMGNYLNKISDSTQRVTAKYVFEGFIDDFGFEIVREINWLFIDALKGAVTINIPTISRKSMDKLINIILSEANLYKEVAEFLVINEVPKHLYKGIKSSLSMDSEAAAILIIAGI